MTNKLRITIMAFIGISSFGVACKEKAAQFDASGYFEADEIMVSAETSGKLLTFNVAEGANLSKNTLVGIIDPLPLQLQQQQIEASIAAIQQKTTTALPAITMLQAQKKLVETQIDNWQFEKKRIEKLLAADAASQKQLDDINYQLANSLQQLKVYDAQIALQQANTATQNRALLSEIKPLEKQLAILKDKEARTKVLNPATGTVLNKFAMEGENITAGKALYKIANLDTVFLRAYISGTQINSLKLQQPVTVSIDAGKDNYQQYKGTICWISSKAEFTPKTIQTKEERVNMVYAIKVAVPNKEGLLKLGMYGELIF
ncbi:MAG: HlyD family secretion protein [Chitinophagaceae bacterium]